MIEGIEDKDIIRGGKEERKMESGEKRMEGKRKRKKKRDKLWDFREKKV